MKLRLFTGGVVTSLFENEIVCSFPWALASPIDAWPKPRILIDMPTAVCSGQRSSEGYTNVAEPLLGKDLPEVE